MPEIKIIVDMIEAHANRFVGIDAGLHHPDPAARLHSSAMLVDAEIMRRMAKLNQRNLDEKSKTA